jgi:hypothetical protein
MAPARSDRRPRPAFAPEGPDSSPTADADRRRLPSPTALAPLGLLALPGYMIEGLEPLRVLGLLFLFACWPLVATLVPSRRPSPIDWVQVGGRTATARFLVSTLALQLNPWVQVQALGQLVGQLAVYGRYGRRLPSPATYEQRTDYRLPVEGEWTVVAGGPDRDSSHSWGIPAQRYALDLVVTDEAGRTHAGDGRDPADYYCWDRPVVAPAAGVVVAAADGHRDAPRTRGWLDVRQRDLRGNYVTIDHGGEYTILAHLRKGSIAVRPGDRVAAGDLVGRCGHSGNSTEPHLHVHVQDRLSFLTGMGLPVAYAAVRSATGPDAPLSPTTPALSYLRAGQRVAHAGADAATATVGPTSTTTSTPAIDSSPSSPSGPASDHARN